MTLVTDQMIEAGCQAFRRTAGTVKDALPAIYLAMQSAQSTPPVERKDMEDRAWDWLESKFLNVEAGHDPNDRDYSADEMVDAFFAGAALTPPPVTAEDEVERLVDVAMRAVMDPGQFVPGYGSDYPSVADWQRAALRAALNERSNR